MFSVIVWKQNFEERNRAGAIAPFSRSDALPYPSTITISALTSKLLRNSKFFQRRRVFLVFLYQIDTSNGYPSSMNLVFYAITSFSITKIGKYLWTKCYCFFIYMYIPNFKKKGLKIQICPSSPQSQIQMGDFTQNGEGCNSKM